MVIECVTFFERIDEIDFCSVRRESIFVSVSSVSDPFDHCTGAFDVEKEYEMHEYVPLRNTATLKIELNISRKVVSLLRRILITCLSNYSNKIDSVFLMEEFLNETSG